MFKALLWQNCCLLRSKLFSNGSASLGHSALGIARPKTPLDLAWTRLSKTFLKAKQEGAPNLLCQLCYILSVFFFAQTFWWFRFFSKLCFFSHFPKLLMIVSVWTMCFCEANKKMGWCSHQASDRPLEAVRILDEKSDSFDFVFQMKIHCSITNRILN